MFERYTEKARRVIFFARYEASEFGSPYIEVEHFLLGLIREDRLLVARFLPKTADVALLIEEVRAGLDKKHPFPTSVDVPLSGEAKRVLAYAVEESERLRSEKLDTGHLLLGILREESSLSVILRRYGFELESVRSGIAKNPSAGAAASNVLTVRELQKQIEEIARHLTSEIEPATVFKLEPK